MQELTRHPLSAAWRDYTAEERDEFAASFDRIGYEPELAVVWTLGGMVLEGWHTYQECLRRGIEPEVREYEGNDPVAFIRAANGGRRHLTQIEVAESTRRMLNHQARAEAAQQQETQEVTAADVGTAPGSFDDDPWDEADGSRKPTISGDVEKRIDAILLAAAQDESLGDVAQLRVESEQIKDEADALAFIARHEKISKTDHPNNSKDLGQSTPTDQPAPSEPKLPSTREAAEVSGVSYGTQHAADKKVAQEEAAAAAAARGEEPPAPQKRQRSTPVQRKVTCQDQLRECRAELGAAKNTVTLLEQEKRDMAQLLEVAQAERTGEVDVLQSIDTVRSLQEQVKTLRQQSAEWQQKHRDSRGEVNQLKRELKAAQAAQNGG